MKNKVLFAIFQGNIANESNKVKQIQKIQHDVIDRSWAAFNSTVLQRYCLFIHEWRSRRKISSIRTK